MEIPNRQDNAAPQNRDTVSRAPAQEDALPSMKKEIGSKGLGDKPGVETPT